MHHASKKRKTLLKINFANNLQKNVSIVLINSKNYLFQDRFKFTILNAVLVAKNGDLAALVDSEARVMLLYCTKEEAIDILTAAKDFQLTGENYVWVVTQSVIENPLQAPYQFPVGMLGKSFYIYIFLI